MALNSFNILFLIILLCRNVSCQNFSSCPSDVDLFPFCYCTGTNFVFLDCSGVQNEEQLELIFTTIFFPVLNIYELKIQNNTDLTYLSRNVFGDATFEVIYFQDVVIEYIDESAFANSFLYLKEWMMNNCYLLPQGFPFSSLRFYTSLVSLHLDSAGQLDVLPKIYSASLETMNIINCQIKYLHVQAFQELSNLTYLYLNNNNISTLSSELFANGSLLQKIHLENNDIELLLTGTFKNMDQLYIINLEKNRISHIQPGSFYNLPKLIRLFLRYNELPYFLFDYLGVLPSLGELYIQFNNIQFLDPDTFLRCPLLNYVAAGNNKLASFGPGTFDVMKSGYIYLNNNTLTVLDEGWLRSLVENLDYVQLYYNPLECGCDVAWLFATPTLMENLGARCGNGTDIQDLDPTFFEINC